MENVTRLNRRMQLATNAVRMDSSEAYFKNNKLSENLEGTIDVLFRKKNSVLIHQRDAVRQAKKDFEYLLAVKQVVNKKQSKWNHRPSTSSSSRDDSTADTAVRRAKKHTIEHKRKIGFTLKGPQTLDSVKTIPLRVPDGWNTRSNSPLEFSDVAETDSTERSDAEIPNNVKQRKSTIRQSDRQSGMVRDQRSTSTMLSVLNQDRYHSSFKPLIGGSSVGLTDSDSSFHRRSNHKTTKSKSSQFRYTRGPSFNSAQKNKCVLQMQTAVYDPGDYTPPRRGNRTPSQTRKGRSESSIGFAPLNDLVDEGKHATQARQSQSAGLSRRQLKEMNNIDALIEASESPLLVDTKKILLAENKRQFNGLQNKVDLFLKSIDEFNKRNEAEKYPSRFLLNGLF